MVKIFYYILFTVLAILLIPLISLGIYSSNSVMHKKVRTYDEIVDLEKKNNVWFIDEFNRLKKQDVEVKSPNGYLLKGFLLKAKDNNSKTVIISHGVTVSRYSSIKYALIFINLGYDVLIYDQRCHGESGGKFISYGFYERYDLKAMVDYIKKIKGPDSLIGIHGESMGSGIALLYAGSIEDGADFYIIDCAYSNFQEEFICRINDDTRYHSSFLVPLTNLFLFIRGRYRLKDINPIKYIKNIKSPILFITSVKDTYIPPKMTMDLYEAKQGPKSIYLAPNGDHAQSFSKNQEKYKEVVERFIKSFENGDTM
ncbi:MAG: alpha/beta hydrolase [Bacillota bacterium]|nr:alpha/beta hydrolase [Bacillota bacterium]